MWSLLKGNKEDHKGQRSGVYTVNFEQISHIVPMLLL